MDCLCTYPSKVPVRRAGRRRHVALAARHREQAILAAGDEYQLKYATLF